MFVHLRCFLAGPSLTEPDKPRQHIDQLLRAGRTLGDAFNVVGVDVEKFNPTIAIIIRISSFCHFLTILHFVATLLKTNNIIETRMIHAATLTNGPRWSESICGGMLI